MVLARQLDFRRKVIEGAVKMLIDKTNVIQEKIETCPHDDHCLLIGQIALNYKFISDKQLQRALSFQKQRKRGSQKLLLGMILVMKEMISQNQLDVLISAQNFCEIRQLERRFGIIAIRNGFATQKEINIGLEKQAAIFKKTKSVKLIGDMLVDLGILTREKRDAVLLRQHRFALLLKQGRHIESASNNNK